MSMQRFFAMIVFPILTSRYARRPRAAKRRVTYKATRLAYSVRSRLTPQRIEKITWTIGLDGRCHARAEPREPLRRDANGLGIQVVAGEQTPQFERCHSHAARPHEWVGDELPGCELWFTRISETATGFSAG